MADKTPPRAPPRDEVFVFPVAEERARVSVRPVLRGGVRIRLRRQERTTPFDAPARRGEAEISRRPVNEVFDVAPPVRREGDVTIIPVIDEVPVVVTRYLVREEILIKHHVLTEHRTGEIVLQQMIAEVERLPPAANTPRHFQENSMATTITAVYDDHVSAESARDALVNAGVPSSAVSIEGGGADVDDDGRPRKRGWLSALFGGHEDRGTYDESLRRGGVVLAAHVDESRADDVVRVLETTDAVDLDERESTWRNEGWSSGAAASSGRRDESLGEVAAEAGLSRTDVSEADRDRGDRQGDGAGDDVWGRSSGAGTATTAAAAAMPSTATPAAAGGTADVIPVVEERLRVGKRDTARGGVRVRSYVVETPVEELVTLRQQWVDVERNPIERPLAPGEVAAAFQERDIVVEEHAEEAVVDKQAVVREEVVVRRHNDQRTETVRDTTKRTEVEVDRDPKGSIIPDGAKGGTGGQSY